MARLSGRDRGQLIVVGGLVLAVLLVALAFTTNGPAVTENLATGADGRDGRDALRFRAATDRAVGDLVVAVNRRNDSSVATLDAALSDGVADWDRLAARSQAAEGAATEVTLRETTHRLRANQTNDTRAFTDADGSANWTVVSGVTTTRTYRMNVSRAALARNCSGGCFRVVADNGSATWRASFTANATTVTVTVDAPAGTATCSAATGTVQVNLTAGRLDGDPCPALDVTAALDGDHDLRYRRGDLVRGTYELVVVDATADETRYADGGDPALSPSVHAATVSVTYRTPRLVYATEFRVVPGEEDG